MEEEKKEMAAKSKARSAVEAKADRTYQKTVSALKKLKEKQTEKMAALVTSPLPVIVAIGPVGW
jgi:hypothetical protein